MSQPIRKSSGLPGPHLSRREFLEITGRGAALASAAALLPAGRAYPEGAAKTIRMGVVGGGFGSSFWWHQHPNCKVTGVTDLYPDRRKRLKERFSCDAVYDSLEIDLYGSLAMTVPGIVAHQSSFKDGEQLGVPQFERPKRS